MNTLSITSTKTMSYDAAASVQGFAIVEKLVSVTGARAQGRPQTARLDCPGAPRGSGVRRR